ncbi:YcnI family protein [Nocardioides sp.]|uniref:YcnI family copper-binding membrane protein n=1 Tax=Nocardioides sp. TaxID=35761 RepID=UPI0035B14175
MSTRTLARACALPAATAAIALVVAAPASAHVGATVTDASAGAFTVATFSVPHGCEGSPTTKIEIQVPESVLSVTPTRNPYYELESTITQLDEPTTDAHGNEVTERTSSITYTATTPLPDGERDTFELSFQVPDAEGEVLAFPTIQTCAKGSTDWIEVAAEGQDADALEHPAPSFEILPASGEGHHGEAASEEPEATEATEADDTDSSAALGWAGLAAGLVGLAAGGLALARTRTAS